MHWPLRRRHIWHSTRSHSLLSFFRRFWSLSDVTGIFEKKNDLYVQNALWFIYVHASLLACKI